MHCVCLISKNRLVKVWVCNTWEEAVKRVKDQYFAATGNKLGDLKELNDQLAVSIGEEASICVGSPE